MEGGAYDLTLMFNSWIQSKGDDEAEGGTRSPTGWGGGVKRDEKGINLLI